MKIWNNLEQGTEQWFRVRAGRPTASHFSSIFTAGGKQSAQWRKYAIKLISDLIRPDLIDPAADDRRWGGNKHTDRGHELEPLAREEFERQMGIRAEQVGFVLHDREVAGCSPDGLIRDPEGNWIAGLEIKSPTAENHATTLLDDAMPRAHAPQVHGSMVVTGLRHWYFVSYCPKMRPFIQRIDWDQYTDQISEQLDRFLIYYGDLREKSMPLLVPNHSQAK